MHVNYLCIQIIFLKKWKFHGYDSILNLICSKVYKVSVSPNFLSSDIDPCLSLYRDYKLHLKTDKVGSNVKMHQRWVEHRLEQRVELRVEQSEEQRVETRMEQKEPSVLILVFRDVYG